MHDHDEPAEPACLSRSEVELELARVALMVMRASPQGGDAASLDAPSHPLAVACTRLLQRTQPEHRPFVEARMLELARCMAGGRADAGHEWIDVKLDAQGAPARAPHARPHA